ncbi:Nucleoside-diphosphate-sugar epimerase [Mucilaginibacter lappiensis]|uniref:Nucleoside-diphosphate-sugar epimerase n=1 Tax=Mucilaginibacter lappiensis TaxID=354630 RepID=A0ABR6PGZ9_9SPHI|nr:SDR family oxidoreductase [Mucilaginibacter lappiensis]MBB6109038.1 nucleoside-diphosphate-sugar epimerase [Mucilaginibacter lappiensis]SIQ73057.1 Nucleoside-diphosphate-sugar epimerase [Mucilaginibacter lappiensis]
MNISILGCGWYGQALAKALISAGHIINGSTTSPQKMDGLAADGIEPYLVNFSPGNEHYDNAFFACDVLFICIPPKSRSGEGPEFIDKIQGVISAIKKHSVKKVVFISSTAVYADVNSEVHELSDPQPNTEAGRILFQAEELFRVEATFKTTIIRFAGLIGPGRDPGRFFAGKKDIANGNAPVNLIHLDDCIGLSMAIIDCQAFGYLFNGCSPDHPGRSEFYTQAAVNSGLEKPEFINELKEWKVVRSVNVEKVLGYRYKVRIE